LTSTRLIGGGHHILVKTALSSGSGPISFGFRGIAKRFAGSRSRGDLPPATPLPPSSKLVDVNDGRRPQGPGASPDGPPGLGRQDSMTRTDEELVARSIGGDADSFNQLVLRWERP